MLSVEPFGDGGGAVDAFAHELELGAFELLGSGYEIARIGPQGSSGEGDYRRACGTREATNPLTALPVVGGVFAVVGVGSGKNTGKELFAAHFLAQGFYFIH